MKTKSREAYWNIYQNKVMCGQLEYLTKQSHAWPPVIFIKTKSRVATWNIYQIKVT